MTTLKACILCIATLLFGVVIGTSLGFYISGVQHKAQAAVESAKVIEVSRNADTSALTQRAADAKAQSIQKEKADAATQEALSKHRDWADQSVPDDVLDAIGL